MQIIKIKKSDKEELYKLALEENKELNKHISRKIYKVKLTKELFEKLFKTHFGKDKYFFGIKEEDKIVAILSGYIKPVPNADVGYIGNLFVSKKFQGKGYSTLLKNHFFKWLKGKDIKYCQLNVYDKNPAKKIYEKWDFNIDNVRMTKRI